MNVEMTLPEAEILIAVLTGAEEAFAIVNPPLVEALIELRPLRSALVRVYLRERIGEGSQQPSGLRGDRGSPGWGSIDSCLRVCADQLAAALLASSDPPAVRQSIEKKEEEATRMDRQTVIPPERATASTVAPDANKVIDEAKELLASISNNGNWQSWRDGNQAINISGQSPFQGDHCGASIVKGLPRAWNPHFVGINVFSLPEEFNVSRFMDVDADFIAAAPRLLRTLIAVLEIQAAVAKAEGR